MEKCPGSSCIHCCVWVACIKFNWATNRVLLATVVENLCPFCLCGREISNASRNALLRRVNIANSLKNEVYILQQETIVAWRVGGKLGHQKNIKRLWIRKSCAVWYQKGHDKKKTLPHQLLEILLFDFSFSFPSVLLSEIIGWTTFALYKNNGFGFSMASRRLSSISVPTTLRLIKQTKEWIVS